MKLSDLEILTESGLFSARNLWSFPAGMMMIVGFEQ